MPRRARGLPRCRRPGRPDPRAGREGRDRPCCSRVPRRRPTCGRTWPRPAAPRSRPGERRAAGRPAGTGPLGDRPGRRASLRRRLARVGVGGPGDEGAGRRRRPDVGDRGAACWLTATAEAPPGERYLLGVGEDGTAYFAVDVGHAPQATDGDAVPAGLRELGARLGRPRRRPAGAGDRRCRTGTRPTATARAAASRPRSRWPASSAGAPPTAASTTRARTRR